MLGTDGTLPFDPQKIAEDILEAVYNPPAFHPWNPVPDPPKEKRSEVEKERVEEAIKWLNSRSPLRPDKTKIDLYLEKRTAHEESIKRKEKSFKDALEAGKRDPRNKSVEDEQASYHRWVAENHRRLNAAVQAAHMDWVTTANKTGVEYHLGFVDFDLNKAIKKVLESQEAPALESGEPSA